MHSSQAERNPLYQQVKTILLKRLTQGEWKPGDRLPAEAVLARETGVSLGTLRRAMELLVAEGVLVRREGVGTEVRTFRNHGYWNRFQILERSDGAPRFDSRTLIAFEHVTPPEIVAKAFGIAPRTPVVRLVRQMQKTISGIERLEMIDEDYLSPVSFPNFTEARFLLRFRPEDSLYKFFDREFGVVITSQKCVTNCERVTGNTALSLGLPADFDQMMLRLVRRSMTYSKATVEYRITRANPENLQVAFDVT